MKLLKRIRKVLPILFMALVLFFGSGFLNPIWGATPKLPDYISEETVQTNGYIACPVCGTKSRFTYDQGWLHIYCNKKESGCGTDSLYAYNMAKEEINAEQIYKIQRKAYGNLSDHQLVQNHMFDDYQPPYVQEKQQATVKNNFKDMPNHMQTKQLPNTYDNSGHIKANTIMLTSVEKDALTHHLTREKIIRLSYQSREEYADVVTTYLKIDKDQPITSEELIEFGKCTNQRERVWKIIKIR